MKQKTLLFIFSVLAMIYVNAQNPLLIPGSVTGTSFNLNLQNGTYQFYPGINTTTMGANGNILGPTLIMQKNDFVNIQSDFSYLYVSFCPMKFEFYFKALIDTLHICLIIGIYVLHKTHNAALCLSQSGPLALRHVCSFIISASCESNIRISTSDWMSTSFTNSAKASMGS